MLICSKKENGPNAKCIFPLLFVENSQLWIFLPFAIGMQFEIGSFLFRKSLAKISIRKKVLRFMNYVFGRVCGMPRNQIRRCAEFTLQKFSK